ncbi:DUF4166 domain-containing protein [Leifsonia sp. NPDC058248]|uniref:DUF4166 domain-containing protein n=1 Tax=Leifsonia sp. NPDC058248 TaxID=3346402 RepID=UPI0036DD2C7A
MTASNGDPEGRDGTGSPYRVVLGDKLDELHPRLRAYFERIPDGSHGYGRGVFDAVGTPRRWLWPIIALVSPAHVIFPVWQRDVPFTVVNRPGTSPAGGAAVRAERVFELGDCRRTMIDEIAAERGRIVDRLGSPVRVESWFRATVVDGGLRLDSTTVVVRFGRAGIRLPRFASPRVSLTERYDQAHDAQRVAITIELPVIGRLYEYAGTFRYEIRTGERTA